MDNDELYTWFLDNYEKSTEGFGKLKDVYTEWKNSDLFMNLSKAERRKNNEKHFKQLVDENMELRKCYTDLHTKRIEGKLKQHRSVIMNWKPKQSNELVEELFSDEE